MDKSQLDNMSNKVAAEFYERIGGEVPEAFKKQWKDKDKDNDGKENEPKPDFLKDKEKKSSGIVAAKSYEDLPAKEKKVAQGMMAKGYNYVVQITTVDGDFGEPLYFKNSSEVGPFLRTFPDYQNAKAKWSISLKDKEKKSSVVPVGVVAALSADGEVEIFEASSLEDAKGLTAALQEKDGYSRIASGPNRDKLSSVELYDHFREFWAGCEKLPEGGMRDNCEKKSKGGDDKKDDDKDDKKPDFLKKKD